MTEAYNLSFSDVLNLGQELVGHADYLTGR